MPLDNVESWKELASPETLEVVRRGLPPGSWDECRNTEWEAVLVFYCEQVYSEENLKFVWAVSEYSRNPSVVKAEEIIEDIIYGQPPLNLYSDSSGPIDEWYKDEDHTLVTDLFDRALGEVNDSFGGTYSTFQASVRTAHDKLLEEDQAPNQDIEVSDPELQDFDIRNVDMAVVDNWNQQALKELDEGSQTGFLQFEDLVIIKHPSGSAVQPYWSWATTQDWAVHGAYVRMEKKGGVFDAGKIKVVGVRPGETTQFEAAVARVSKKKVTY